MTVVMMIVMMIVGVMSVHEFSLWIAKKMCYYKACSNYKVKTFFMQIKQLSEKSAIHAETIRYYEKIGLMPSPKRGTNGYRLYANDSLEWLKFIKKCRTLGFTLDDIQKLLALQHTPEKHQDADELVLCHLQRIENQEKELQQMKVFLQNLILHHEHNSDECKVMTGLIEWW